MLACCYAKHFSLMAAHLFFRYVRWQKAQWLHSQQASTAIIQLCTRIALTEVRTETAHATAAKVGYDVRARNQLTVTVDSGWTCTL